MSEFSIYMVPQNKLQEHSKYHISVFLRGSKDLADDLFSFLNNQNLECTRISDAEKTEMKEFPFFSDGFSVLASSDKWSFYELRAYIEAYANASDKSYLIRESIVPGMTSGDQEISFDDKFYLKLLERIDDCEDRYYLSGNDLGQFYDGILKILNENLNLYWGAVKDVSSLNDEEYTNHVPSVFPKQEVLESLEENNSELIVEEIKFNDKQLALLYLLPGPFSPRKKIVHEFLEIIIKHVDDFIYGVVSHKLEIAELKKVIYENAGGEAKVNELKSRDRKKMRLLMFGALQCSKERAQSIFKEYGYEDVKIIDDYDKMRKFDSNTLLIHRARYDGVLLGPMPHKMGNTGNLISEMTNNSTQYPPNVVITNNALEMKITKNSLRRALMELKEKLDQVEYNLA